MFKTHMINSENNKCTLQIIWRCFNQSWIKSPNMTCLNMQTVNLTYPQKTTRRTKSRSFSIYTFLIMDLYLNQNVKGNCLKSNQYITLWWFMFKVMCAIETNMTSSQYSLQCNHWTNTSYRVIWIDDLI